MEELTLVQKFAIWALPVLFAITVHETAHGWVAGHFGDDTAGKLGRLTLNPFKHIDPVGTVLVPGAMLMVSGFLFGWAKPVPVIPGKLRRPKQDMVWVALAGPFSNFLMALGWLAILKVGTLLAQDNSWMALPMIYSGAAGITINAILGILNLLPVPPLDGGRVLVGILPYSWAVQVAKLEPFGFPILLVLIFTGLLGKTIGPMVGYSQYYLYKFAGLESLFYPLQQLLLH